jgi:serine/threonine protein kinase
MSAAVAALMMHQSNRCALWAHLGDTRIYLFRNGKIKHLTKDHALVQRFVDAGYAGYESYDLHQKFTHVELTLKTEELFANTVTAPLHGGTENCLAIGTRLVDFEITGILGEGGFGIVYLAFDHSLQRTVAIKEYMPGTLAGRAADESVTVRADRHHEAFNAGLRSFINEARLLAQFDHPSLVNVYRFWEQNETAYMAMRYYDGQTLKDIVRERPEIVTEAWLKFIFKQILEALDTLYKAKILHRDVSPDNIIVQKNGDAVLLDFGSARQIIGDMTQGLTVILKPGYAPIEQYSDDATMEQGPWTDIYALAAVMYFAITKSAPTTSVARMIKDALVPLQDATHIGCSYKFLVAIDKGLTLQPQDRPQSMDEFRRLLGIAAFVSGRSSRGSRSSSRSSSDAARSSNNPNSASGASSPSGQLTVNGEKTSSRLRKSKRAAAAAAAAAAVVDSEKTVRIEKKRNMKPIMFGGAAVLASWVLAGVAFVASNGDTPPQQGPVGQKSPVAPAVKAWPVVDSEGMAWDALAKDPAARQEQVKGFIAQYPSGKHLGLAQTRLSEMQTNASEAAAQLVAENEAAAAAAKAPVEPPVYSVSAKLLIKPWGTVFLDGKNMGASPPTKRLKLTEGKYKIRIVNDAFPPYETEVEISKANKKKSVIINHDFTLNDK